MTIINTQRGKLIIEEPNLMKEEHLHLKCGAISRIYVAILLIVIAFIQYIEFGIEFNIENGEGNWLFLGGPSLFYPTAVIPLLLTVLILIYSIGSWKTIDIRYNISDLILTERKCICPWKTQQVKIQIHEIHHMNLSNAKISPQYLWIFPFGIHIWFLGIDAIKYLTNPFAFDRGYVTGVFFLIQVIADIIAIVVLIFHAPMYMEIYDSHQKITIREFVRDKSGRLYDQLLAFVDDVSTSNISIDIDRRNLKSKILSQPKFYKNKLVTSLIFFSLVLISRVFIIYAGEPLQMALTFTGVLIIIRVFAESTQNILDNILVNENGPKNSLISSKYRQYWTIGLMKDANSIPKSLWKGLRLRSAKSSVLEYMGMTSIIIIGVLQLCSVYYLVPVSSSSYMAMITMNWIGLILIILAEYLFLSGYKKRRK
jgi:hypothetical protein